MELKLSKKEVSHLLGCLCFYSNKRFCDINTQEEEHFARTDKIIKKLEKLEG